MASRKNGVHCCLQHNGLSRWWSLAFLLCMASLHATRATIVISSKSNPSISGIYVRGVLPGHEKAFAKAATSSDGERLDLWLYSLDRGQEGIRWQIGMDITSDIALTFIDTWSPQNPCGSRTPAWMIHQDGIWQPDTTISIDCLGYEPGGIDSCSDDSNAVVPCMDLTGTGDNNKGPVAMPIVMLGTAYISASHGAGADNPEVVEPPPAIETALDIGYQGLDLGSQLHPAYANERAVGDLLAQRPNRRKSIFLTTKLSPNEHGYTATLKAVQRSLQLLRTDTIDLFLIHHPNCLMVDHCEGDWVQSWKAMERLLGLGAVRAIGVSNFDYHLLHRLLGDPRRTDDAHPGIAKAPVSLIQNRADPLALEDPNLLALCQAHDINYQAFSVLGRQWVVGPWSDYWKAPAHPVLGHPHVQAIANRLSAELTTKAAPRITPAQVILRWAIQQGWTVVPKTAKLDRLESNRRTFHFNLTDLDMGILNQLKPPPRNTKTEEL